MNEWAIYEVGASLRREFLQEENPRRDFVIPGASAEQLMSRGYTQQDGLGHRFSLDGPDRYFTAAIEMPMAGKRPHVQPLAAASLEQDLARRDLTINAMARDASGQVIDPFGGQQDLADGRLRHINDQFANDPLRLLRTARLAAQYAHWGFRLAHGTANILKAMAVDERLQALTDALIEEELQLAMVSPTPSRFLSTLARCGAFELLFPEARATGDCFPSSSHDADLPAWMKTLDSSGKLGSKDGMHQRLSVLSEQFGEAFINRWFQR
ncbi:MAG: hypothetical protein ACPG4N_08480 [Gammaproteobacteria bacterium]